MKLGPHLLTSTALGTVITVSTGEPLAIPITIAAGVLPDTDHLLDFYWHYIRKSRKRLFVLFHGWEFVFVLFGFFFCSAAFYPQHAWWLGSIFAGYTSQLGLDQIGNGAKWNTYFFLWRLSRGFKRRESYGGDNPGAYKALTGSLPWIGPKMVPWFEAREREMYPELYNIREEAKTVNWHSTNAVCPRCGSSNTNRQPLYTGFKRICWDCNLDY